VKGTRLNIILEFLFRRQHHLFQKLHVHFEGRHSFHTPNQLDDTHRFAAGRGKMNDFNRPSDRSPLGKFAEHGFESERSIFLSLKNWNFFHRPHDASSKNLAVPQYARPCSGLGDVGGCMMETVSIGT